ncbi:MAG: ABC transporter substrate-binding protein [Anaerolineae bacterium]
MKKQKLISIILTLATILVVVGWGQSATAAPAVQTAPEEGRVYKLGYSVIVEHPSLQKGFEGILAGLKKAGFEEGQNLEIDLQNAQGEVANTRSIAEKFVADKVDLIIGHTTPSAQAAVQVAEGTDIPVVFFGISDPVGAGLVASVEEPSGSNVTGEWGPVPYRELFDLYAEVLPTMKKVGVLYNAGESNSVAAIEQVKAIAEEKGYEVVEATVASSADVKTAAESLIGQVDAIVLPQDNTVVSALDAVVQVAEQNQIPLFPMDPDSVKAGAIAAVASDPVTDGVITGILIARMLLGEQPGDITPIIPSQYDVYVNSAAAEKMGVTVPQAVLDQAKEVYR